MLKINIATFNLENLTSSRQHPEAFKLRRDALEPKLKSLDFDIICLQEINAQKPHKHHKREFVALNKLFENTNYENFYCSSTLRPDTDAPNDIHNVVILSRWPFEHRQQIYHELIPRWSWRPPLDNGVKPQEILIEWDRPALYVSLILPTGQRLHIFNVHLRAPRPAPVISARGQASSRAKLLGYYIAALKREGQALEVRLFAENIFDVEHDPLIAICGDFNADAHDAPTQLLRGAQVEAEENARMLVSLEKRVDKAHAYSVIHAGKTKLLDHILASPALAACWRQTRIFNEDLQDEAAAKDPIAGSLHAPVVTHFHFTCGAGAL